MGGFGFGIKVDYCLNIKIKKMPYNYHLKALFESIKMASVCLKKILIKIKHLNKLKYILKKYRELFKVILD